MESENKYTFLENTAANIAGFGTGALAIAASIPTGIYERIVDIEGVAAKYLSQAMGDPSIYIISESPIGDIVKMAGAFGILFFATSIPAGRLAYKAINNLEKSPENSEIQPLVKKASLF